MKKITKLQMLLTTDNIKDHRYKSIDDWQEPFEFQDKILFATQTADMKNIDYNFLVLMHALVEQYLCYRHGITDEQVTKYDKEHTHCEDPGSHELAPYHQEHSIATDVESIISVALDVSWDKYDAAINKTLKKWKK